MSGNQKKEIFLYSTIHEIYVRLNLENSKAYALNQKDGSEYELGQYSKVTADANIENNEISKDEYYSKCNVHSQPNDVTKLGEHFKKLRANNELYTNEPQENISDKQRDALKKELEDYFAGKSVSEGVKEIIDGAIEHEIRIGSMIGETVSREDALEGIKHYYHKVVLEEEEEEDELKEDNSPEGTKDLEDRMWFRLVKSVYIISYAVSVTTVVLSLFGSIFTLFDGSESGMGGVIIMLIVIGVFGIPIFFYLVKNTFYYIVCRQWGGPKNQ